MPKAPPRKRTDPQSIQFEFDGNGKKSPDEPDKTELRLFWLFLELMRHKRAGFAPYAKLFIRDTRTFARDIKRLRILGKQYGFELTPVRKQVVHLKAFDAQQRLPQPPEAGTDALRALAEAFGAVVAASLGEAVDLTGVLPDRFLHVATPRLIAETAVGDTYRSLRAAWKAGARVRFRYPDVGGKRAPERNVEPYATTYYAGRYYLVGYDTQPRVGWRQFALDRIVGKIAREGLIQDKKPIPDAYKGDDAIGLFKSSTQTPTDVTVRLSSRIAQAVTARTWQADQRVEERSDGTTLFTIRVHDIGEAVRWACGFGVEATVVSPEKAVDLAREIVDSLAGRYAKPGPASRDGSTAS